MKMFQYHMKGLLKLSKDTWVTSMPEDQMADSVSLGWKGNPNVGKQRKDNLDQRKDNLGQGKKSQHQRNQAEHGWVF